MGAIAAGADRWYNELLCRGNKSVVRVGIVEGEYHWHKHDGDDEFFDVARSLIHNRPRPYARSSAGEGAETPAAGRPVRVVS